MPQAGYKSRTQAMRTSENSVMANFAEFFFLKLSKKSLSSVSSAEIAVISQRNEPSLLCFVGFDAFVLRLAKLFRQSL
jgi:hypothetical protein